MVNRRWTALSGIVFVALMLVGASFVTDVPKADASASEIAGYLADSGNHTRNIVGAYLWVLGGLAFLGFVAGLRGVLRRAEGDTGTLSSLVFGAGVVFTAVWSVSAVALAAVAYATEFSNAPLSNPDIVRVLPQLASFFCCSGAASPGSPCFWRPRLSSCELASFRAGSHGSGSSSRSRSSSTWPT